jgi:Ca2+/Na+ antiporter
MEAIFGSNQAKLLAVVSAIALLVSQYGKIRPLIILSALIFLCLTAFNVTCLVKGGCNIWAWLQIIIPVALLTLDIWLMYKEKEGYFNNSDLTE